MLFLWSTLSVPPRQVLSVWDWTVESKTPLCHAALSTDFGRQSTLTFHPTDHSQLISNSDYTVVFYHWVSGGCVKPHLLHHLYTSILFYLSINRKDQLLIFTPPPSRTRTSISL